MENKIIDSNKIKMRKCGSCGSYYELGSLNSRLFRMPTGQEWLTLLMLALIIIAAFAYKHDIQTCRNYISEQKKQFVNNSNIPESKINTSFINDPTLIFTNDTNKES